MHGFDTLIEIYAIFANEGDDIRHGQLAIVALGSGSSQDQFIILWTKENNSDPILLPAHQF